MQKALSPNTKFVWHCINFYLILILTGCAAGQLGKNNSGEFKNGMVVSANGIASKVGISILKKGGNAVDAAVAVQFALAVVYPNAGNIGGGGFMVYRAASGETNSLDFREKAPSAATRDMYLDSLGNPIVDKSLHGQIASGVPGSVAGMEAAHKKYGKLSWSALLQPAIDLAKNGFPITKRQASQLNANHPRFMHFNPDGTALIKLTGPWQENDLLVQTQLANTLTFIQQKGKSGFYEGAVADSIVAEMKAGNGIITHEDLKNYRAIWRKPVTGTFKGYDVITMPPPSSGGIALMQLLESVEPYPFKKWGHNADSTFQVMVEAERRAYADRATHLGDADFYNVPQTELLKPTYNKARMASFSFDSASTSASIKAGEIDIPEHLETTHFSIVDRAGNAVAITTTLNASFGSLIVVKGAGFLLNDEMDDFSVKAGAPNMFGLIGGKANEIAANKRMLSSMTPTILAKDGKLFMVVGTPGGSTIITSVFQTILNVIDFDMTMQQAVDAKRFHHQWLPDEVDVEKTALDSVKVKKLEEKGYKIIKSGNIGRVDAILRTPRGKYLGGADSRGDDKVAGY
ncbi:gamma-glutamyltranspeptidase/glutathione hydrolase [Pedobacter sp. UYP30]|uniref:gamma-glutamyltransferase n=1 Tax=Pedobacter sp. UYP30 TaxID=1756400 RepID=UPI0033990D8F